MRDQRVSSVLLEKDGTFFGLITDRDLHNRVMAAGLDPQTAIMEIATLAKKQHTAQGDGQHKQVNEQQVQGEHPRARLRCFSSTFSTTMTWNWRSSKIPENRAKSVIVNHYA
jgi:hypothetical protein